MNQRLLFIMIVFLFFSGAQKFCRAAAAGFYPQIYETTDEKKSNLYTSSVYRQKNARFIRELEDSVGRLQKDYRDSGMRTIIAFVKVHSSGAVDSVALQTPDTLDTLLLNKTRERILGWKLSFHPPDPVLFVRDINFAPHHLPRSHTPDAATTPWYKRSAFWLLLLGVVGFGFLVAF
ncbi:MAG: hypothetical protein PHC61_16035 [Chitinivibrionales bacterium]|nr:hypothetical protein [Chitinivibrionales bacterium]